MPSERMSGPGKVGHKLIEEPRGLAMEVAPLVRDLCFGCAFLGELAV